MCFIILFKLFTNLRNNVLNVMKKKIKKKIVYEFVCKECGETRLQIDILLYTVLQYAYCYTFTVRVLYELIVIALILIKTEKLC